MTSDKFQRLLQRLTAAQASLDEMKELLQEEKGVFDVKAYLTAAQTYLSGMTVNLEQAEKTLRKH